MTWMSASEHLRSMSMPRQMIRFTKPQMTFLKAESKRLGITVSDLIRRILDLYRHDHEVD